MIKFQYILRLKLGEIHCLKCVQIIVRLFVLIDLTACINSTSGYPNTVVTVTGLYVLDEIF